MAFVNNTMIVRRELMSKLISLHKDNKLIEEIDRIPLRMSPKNAQARGDRAAEKCARVGSKIPMPEMPARKLFACS